MATPGQKEREAELHSVLRAANLLDYYQSFLEQGGDDVQQFCDAGEDEFKEIIGLVGMSTKPLHTRRLQKALVEWKSKRGHSPERISPGSWMDKWTSSPQVNRTPPPSTSSPAAGSGRKRRSSSSGGKGGVEKRVVELKLPPMEVIIDWEKLDPERQQLIRDHSRIYGRDIKKRKTNTLNSHEQMINEAAAQLCLRDPTLLVRRDELFTMARRVVRDSGFTFVHGHSRSKFVSESDEELDVTKKNQVSQANKLKREERLHEIDDLLQNNKELQEQIMQKLDEARALSATTEINELQADLSKLQSQQVSLQLEHKELKKKQRRSERYYTNKQTKDSGSQGNSVHDDDVDMVGDVSLQGELTPDDHSEEGLTAENAEEEGQVTTVEQSRTMPVPEAVVTQILPPASGIPTTSSNVTVNLPQRQEPLNPEEESSVRALYTAFMPQHLQTEVVQQVQQQAEGGQIIPGYSQALVSAAVSSDPTINALLSLGAKDKVLLPGMLPPGAVAAVPVTSGVVTTASMTPGITVVMPGQPLPGHVQWS
ncbi:uncharacterized protein LOC144661321 [Oculina patagonica]